MKTTIKMAKNIQEFVGLQVSKYVDNESYWTSKIQPRSIIYVDKYCIYRIPDSKKESDFKTPVRFVSSSLHWHPAIDPQTGKIYGSSVSDVMHRLTDLKYASNNNPVNKEAANHYLNNPKIYWEEKKKFPSTSELHQKIIDVVLGYCLNGTKWKYT